MVGSSVPCQNVTEQEPFDSSQRSSESSQEKGIIYYYNIFDRKKIHYDKIMNLGTNVVYCFADGFRWPHEAILLLLTLYKEHEHHSVSGKMTMKKFWGIIASRLNEKDYDVTGS